jgi:hypothetical protein
VLVEATVLDCHDGLAHDGRNLGQRHLDSVLFVDGRDETAVCGEDS